MLVQYNCNALGTINKTFRLHEDVAAAIEQLAAEDGARSQTAFVEELVRRETKRRARERRMAERREAYAKAFADPEYRAEQMQIEAEFWPLDREAWLKADPDPSPDSAGR
jgi:hypothetical protein